MLVLSRKIHQSFRLGDDIRITVVKTDRDSVRIGIEAPNGVSVRREEIIVAERLRSGSRRADAAVA